MKTQSDYTVCRLKAGKNGMPLVDTLEVVMSMSKWQSLTLNERMAKREKDWLYMGVENEQLRKRNLMT